MQRKWQWEEDSELVHSNLLFQAELQNVLTLLVKEKSLRCTFRRDSLRCISVSKSAFGAIVFLEDNKKFNFLFLDTHDVIKSKEDAEGRLNLISLL
jgi:hypothetical protein